MSHDDREERPVRVPGDGSGVHRPGPLAVAQVEACGDLFVALSVSDQVVAVDVSTGRVTDRISVGWAPRNLTAVPETPYLLVANAGCDSVSVVDTGKRRETARLRVGREPGAIAVSQDGSIAVVCERGAGSVVILDLTTLGEGRPGRMSVASRTLLGVHAQPRAASFAGPHVLIAAARLNAMPVLAVADGHVDAMVALTQTGLAPAGISVTGEHGYAVVTLERAGTRAVVDLLEWTITRQIPLGAGPRGITVDPDDQSVYCALAQQRSLAVIHLDGVDLSTTDGHPQFESLPAGVRPTAVTIALAHEPQPEPGPATPPHPTPEHQAPGRPCGDRRPGPCCCCRVGEAVAPWAPPA
ncbi:YncE family protein [Streptomyces sp. NPDC087917]|uniref:YncE family protein n=1 Tax=Streptomyces sp. NPDC087917 TaxID=3155060 RepID=UPI0034390495